MTGPQFMCILGTIYLSHDMSESFREKAGLLCFVIAILLDIFGK